MSKREPTLPFPYQGYSCPDCACLCQREAREYLRQWYKLVPQMRACARPDCSCHQSTYIEMTFGVCDGGVYCCGRCRVIDHRAIHDATVVALRLLGVGNQEQCA